MQYPDFECVNQADRIQLARWIRFLPSPGINHIGQNDFSEKFRMESEILDLIIQRFSGIGGWTSMISKIVGHEI